MKAKVVTIVKRMHPDKEDVFPTGQRQLWFWCAGCQMPHSVNVALGSEPGPLWVWDGDLDRPTISPSVRVTYGRADRQCHFFLKGGVVEYLGDCTHELTNQRVPLLDMPSWLADD